MQTGKMEFHPPRVKKQIFEKTSPGIKFEAFQAVVKFLNNTMKKRDAYLIIYFNPGIEKYSKEIGLSTKDFFITMNYLSSFYPSIVRRESCFEFDGLNEKLHEEDIVLLETHNRYQNPYNAKVIYENAHDYIRYYYKVGCKK